MINNGDQGSIIGGWDVHNKQYVLSTKKANTTEFNTLCFDEDVLGWTSFFTYNPEQILSLRNKLYTVGTNADETSKRYMGSLRRDISKRFFLRNYN